MRIGTLFHPIEIQEQSDGGRDRHGGDILDAWKTIGKVRAEVRPLSGREFLQAQQVDSRITHMVTIRNFKGLTSSNRILHRNRILEIISVRNIDERRHIMVLMVMENTGTEAV